MIRAAPRSRAASQLSMKPPRFTISRYPSLFGSQLKSPSTRASRGIGGGASSLFHLCSTSRRSAFPLQAPPPSGASRWNSSSRGIWMRWSRSDTPRCRLYSLSAPPSPSITHSRAPVSMLNSSPLAIFGKERQRAERMGEREESHQSEVSAPVAHSPIGRSLRSIDIESREVDPVVLAQVPCQDRRLVAHPASLPGTLHLLQRDNVRATHRVRDTFEIDAPVEPHSKAHVVGHDFHEVGAWVLWWYRDGNPETLPSLVVVEPQRACWSVHSSRENAIAQYLIRWSGVQGTTPAMLTNRWSDNRDEHDVVSA